MFLDLHCEHAKERSQTITVCERFSHPAGSKREECHRQATLIAQRPSVVLLFRANRLLGGAKAWRNGSVGAAEERIGQSYALRTRVRWSGVYWICISGSSGRNRPRQQNLWRALAYNAEAVLSRASFSRGVRPSANLSRQPTFAAVGQRTSNVPLTG